MITRREQQEQFDQLAKRFRDDLGYRADCIRLESHAKPLEQLEAILESVTLLKQYCSPIQLADSDSIRMRIRSLAEQLCGMGYLLKGWSPNITVLKCNGILDNRGEEYNGGGIVTLDYFPYGHLSHFQITWMKCLRIASIFQSQDWSVSADKSRSLSRIEDCIIDGINYLSFWYAYTMQLGAAPQEAHVE